MLLHEGKSRFVGQHVFPNGQLIKQRYVVDTGIAEAFEAVIFAEDGGAGLGDEFGSVGPVPELLRALEPGVELPYNDSTERLVIGRPARRYRG